MFEKLISKIKRRFAPDIREEDKIYMDEDGSLAAPQAQAALPSGQMEAVFKKLSEFSAAREAADSINEKKLVIINLEGADSASSRRIIDFLSGVAYANSAALSRAAAGVFVITPYFADTVNEMKDKTAEEVSAFDGISF